jgi:hypothetical protein
MSPDRCPPDPEETAEQYVLGKLSPAAPRRGLEDLLFSEASERGNGR